MARRLSWRDGARHSPDWYDQTGGTRRLEPGDRMFIACRGGPCVSRLEAYPPRFEVGERDGIYVLVDDGPVNEWWYSFIPHSP